MSFQEFIDHLTQEDVALINKAFKEKEKKIPTYKYSKIKDSDLRALVNIEENLSSHAFKTWFDNDINISNDTEVFLKEILENNKPLIKSYNEEELKVKFLALLLYKVNFKSIENNFRDFCEVSLTYKTDTFIFTGNVDFLVAKGLVYSQEPYFFIQEFKRAEEYSNPRPQLLAELISAVELNNFKAIKGAYIMGAIWNFVILEKLADNTYQYFVSQNFDSSKLPDLIAIYKNLVYVKNEIINILKDDSSI